MEEKPVTIEELKQGIPLMPGHRTVLVVSGIHGSAKAKGASA